MREIFKNELDEIGNQVQNLTKLVSTAIKDASSAMLKKDIEAAKTVISGDTQIDNLEVEISEACIESLALQQPVASDLRLLIGVLQICSALERMGDYAAHIAEFTAEAYPEAAFYKDYRKDIEALAENANKICKAVSELFASQSLDVVKKIATIDLDTDKIYERLNNEVRSDSFTGKTKQAVNLALIIRFYERFGDHAVSISKRFSFISTGDYSKH